MKDRVAKVLFGWMHGHDRWDDAQPEEREDCMEAARAAIEAMREPTQVMVDIGTVRHRNVVTGPLGVPSCVNQADCAIVWQAMIDAALK